MVARGFTDCDFAALLELTAEASGMKVESENGEIDKGI